MYSPSEDVYCGVLCCIRKTESMFEKLLHTLQVSNMNIYYELKHGFREKRYCETQLMMLTDEAIQIYADGQPDRPVFIDFSKAF